MKLSARNLGPCKYLLLNGAKFSHSGAGTRSKPRHRHEQLRSSAAQQECRTASSSLAVTRTSAEPRTRGRWPEARTVDRRSERLPLAGSGAAASLSRRGARQLHRTAVVVTGRVRARMCGSPSRGRPANRSPSTTASINNDDNN